MIFVLHKLFNTEYKCGVVLNCISIYHQKFAAGNLFNLTYDYLTLSLNVISVNFKFAIYLINWTFTAISQLLATAKGWL